MRKSINFAGTMFLAGGWAPLLVFTAHLFAVKVFHVYSLWPSFDTPMHFAGGLAVAFFTSRLFRELPVWSERRYLWAVIELILIGCVTATVAVFWEFYEFANDQLFSTSIQVSLSDTMKDLALGLTGAAVFILIRALRIRIDE